MGAVTNTLPGIDIYSARALTNATEDSLIIAILNVPDGVYIYKGPTHEVVLYNVPHLGC